MDIPRLARVVQTFPDERIDNIEAKVIQELEGSGAQIRPGMRVALAAGSRGIADIARVVKAAADWLKAKGAQPFVVPAMGSHGGATAEGQRQVLAGYGISEETMGAPVLSSMEVVELPRGGLCHPVYMDRNAYEADGVVVINRVKVHTDYHGRIESGLMKMCVIGLGKQRQALVMHGYGVYGLRELIPIAARHILSLGKVILGLGLVENAHDRLMEIRAALPQDTEETEAGLLELCRRNMPRLPADELDVLIIDEMGKDVSGVGIDPNITGRLRIRGEQEPRSPRITDIVVADLTEASHGNALGMGLADFITERLRAKIDFRATYENVLTSTFIERGRMPVVAANDRLAVEYALAECRLPDTAKARVVRIKNTLCLGEVYASEAVLDGLRAREGTEIAGPPEEMFDGTGALRALWREGA
jgi:hypothetical protein